MHTDNVITKRPFKYVENNNTKYIDSNSNNVENDEKPAKKNKNGPDERVFIPRNSPLIELIEISHIKTIYRGFLAIFLLEFTKCLVVNFLESKSVMHGFRLIGYAFGKIHITFVTWLGIQIIACLFYLFYKKWAVGLKCYKPIDKSHPTYNYSWIFSYVVFQGLFFTGVSSIVIYYNLPPASGFIITLEMVRLLMKFYAFVRTVSPKILYENNDFPPFSSYLYYLFAPTFIYKNSYPRTSTRNWFKITMYLMEVIGCVLFLNFQFDKYICKQWKDFGLPTQKFDATRIINLYINAILPSWILVMCCFYMILHSWCNASAEIMKFADRQFYTDWWNQKGYKSYYRTWNIVVQDWLYFYVYRDAIDLTKNRVLAELTVFFISAIFHEAIITVTLGFFYPVMFFNFMIPGYLFTYVEKHMSTNVGNMFFWITFTLGICLIWTTYSAEYYARLNCPMTVDNKYLDLLIPRSWFCY